MTATLVISLSKTSRGIVLEFRTVVRFASAPSQVRGAEVRSPTP